MNVPGGFIPDEDQGYFYANVKLPDSASLERTGGSTRRHHPNADGYPRGL